MKQILGEGGFGCVHKPSLRCRSGGLPPAGKVSKVLKIENAESELAELREINYLTNGAQYVLPEPAICVPNPAEIENIRNCSKFSTQKNTNDLALLILDDAGKSLNTITKASLSADILADILKEAEVLFDAICFFQEKKYIHFDIKPNNIMYNIHAPRGKKLKIIDFGMAGYISEFQKRLPYRKRKSYIFHPAEIVYANVKTYNEKYNRGRRAGENFARKVHIEHNRAVISYTRSSAELLARMNEDSLLTIKRTFTGIEIIDGICRTCDSYGLGITLQRCIMAAGGGAPQLEELFYNMFHPNPERRMDIFAARERYIGILRGGAAPAAICAPNKEWYEPARKCFVKCRAGQVRNSVTRRCRAVAARGTRRNMK